MATRTSTIINVRRKLKITGTAELLTDTEIGNSVDEAVLKYSKDKPLVVYSQFQGQNEHDFDLSDVLSLWTDNFSVIKNVEYPVGGQTKQEIEDIDYEVYYPDTTAYSLATASSAATTVTLSTASQAVFFKDNNVIYIASGTDNEVNWVNGDGNITTGVVTLKNALAKAYTSTPTMKRRKALRFNYYSPGTTEIVKAEYTTTYTLGTSDNIPSIDLNALEDLAAGISAQKIHAKFAKEGRSSISSDSIDYLDKAREWATVAVNYIASYEKHIGIDDDEPIGASVDQDQDTFFKWGTDYLFNNRRWR